MICGNVRHDCVPAHGILDPAYVHDDDGQSSVSVLATVFLPPPIMVALLCHVIDHGVGIIRASKSKRE